jgi:hypothetical protein
LTRLGQAASRVAGNPGVVPSTSSLDEVILFEISGFEQALELCELLARERLAWMESRDDLRRVAALLRPGEEDDLAALLRTAEGWVAERGLVAIRFEVDGRAYLLAAAPAIAPTVSV